MPPDRFRTHARSLWHSLYTRVSGWFRPTHPRFALHLFLAALAVGLLLGLAWMATHRIALDFHAPIAAGAQASDPGAPLPTPRTGGKGALPMAGTSSTSQARIENPAPIAADATMDASAQISPATADGSADTIASPLPTDAAAGAPRTDQGGPSTLPADPGQASRVGQHADVTLSVQIDAQGNPLQVSVQQSSGSPAIDNAALLEVRGRHFTPTLRDGQPVPATLSVSVRLPLGNG